MNQQVISLGTIFGLSVACDSNNVFMTIASELNIDYYNSANPLQ